ncbi:MAG: hypothetical protein IPQ07_30235 [Myxococcales bacterium]|nr:hypothetical protein [Myxococcales bacterium]
MRHVALGMLAASSLAGCNLVFGLDETSPAPPPPADAPDFAVRLTLLQLTSDSMGWPVAPISAAIPDLIKVEASRFEQAPTTLTLAPDGRIVVPTQIAGMPGWRLVYQRAGEVPREIQDPLDGTHLVEPLFGPLQRTSPPTNSGYTITPTGYPGTGSHAGARVFTTGVWTEGSHTFGTVGEPKCIHELADAISLSGPPGTPGPSDHGFLVDFTTQNGCRYSTGSAEFVTPGAGPPKPEVTPPWINSAVTPTITPVAFNVFATTEVQPLGETVVVSRLEYGYLPSAAMPAFTRDPDPARSLLLRNPAMITIMSCDTTATLPSINELASLRTELVPAVHLESYASRILPGGPSLVSGLAVVVPEPPFTVNYKVAFASAVKLTATDGTVVDLFGASDGVVLPAATGPLTLSWAPSKPGATADYWEVALLRVAGTTLVKERVYVTTQPSLKISRSELNAGSEYVLELSGFVGRASAATGDFATIGGRQEMSVVNARSFRLP